MKRSVQKILAAFTGCLLIFVMLGGIFIGVTFRASGSERRFEGEVQKYYQALLDKGFPADYAVSLTELHLLHPNWEFEPLLITETEPTYTWSYVLQKETEEPETNLVSSSDIYLPYRHETNTTRYDSGGYQASAAAVSYFMDARNFLNEKDIFQFYDLSAVLSSSGTQAAVESVLEGTFMEDRYLENGMTYAAYFCKVGEALSVNPIFLAVKARQEQGTKGTSPVISGKCGTLLAEYYKNNTQISSSGSYILTPSEGYSTKELKQLDGYYNIFNINASGNGIFQIYYGAMQWAVRGTESMKTAWGGSPSWNTMWKSIYGGSNFIKVNYCDRYQSTIYLQKFNVDSRAGDRNFWAQYMQTVTSAKAEGRALYHSLADADVLDQPAVFSIPVYGGMPATQSPDPGASEEKRIYQNTLSTPESMVADNAAVYLTTSAYTGTPICFKGSVSHTDGVERLQYSLNGGTWMPLSESETFNLTLPGDFLSGTTHILTIRGIADYSETNTAPKNTKSFLCAVIYINVLTPPKATVSLSVGNTTTDFTRNVGSTFSLPACELPDFAGWLGSDGSFLPEGAELELQQDVSYRAIFPRFFQLEGAALTLGHSMPSIRYSALLCASDLALLESNALSVKASATVTQAGQPQEACRFTDSAVRYGETDYILLCAETAPLSENEYTTEYNADFSLQITYSNGEQRTIEALGSNDRRSAVQIATAALADASHPYSETTVRYLETIAKNAIE